MAGRKVRGLQKAGAEILVVSPGLAPELEDAEVEVWRRGYRDGDLEGAHLAFAATDSREVNAAVAREARDRGIPVNVADKPGEGDFALPSTLRRGGLQVAVSTGGASPTLARRVRLELEEMFGSEWAGLVDELEAARRNGDVEPGLEEEVVRCLSRLRG